VVRKEGDADAALKSADKVHHRRYYLPHLAHVSMEPRRRRRRQSDKCEILGAGAKCRRHARGRRQDARIPEGNVTVNVTLLGGGFGRKSKCDFAIEAALLSKELGPRPSRCNGPARTTFITASCTRFGERIEAGLDKSGKVIAWRHRSVAPTIASTFAAGAAHAAPFELAWDWIDKPVRDRQPAMREPGSCRAYPHRLVPFGVEHPARLCGPVHVAEIASRPNATRRTCCWS